MTPGRVLYLMLVTTALALALVWQRALIRETGYRMARLRAEISEQQTELASYQAQISKLRNPQRILALVEWLGLDLRERVPLPESAPPDGEGTTEPVTHRSEERVTANLDAHTLSALGAVHGKHDEELR